MDYAVAFVGIVLVVTTYAFLRRGRTIKYIQSPPSPSWVFGNMLQLFLPEEYGDNEFAWLKSFGAVYRLKGCFGQDRLMVADPAALQHILNSPHFEHGPSQKAGIDLLFPEKCVMRAQQKAHKRLRAALNPGFSGAAVRNFQPIFERAAQKAAEKLEEFSESSAAVDICPVLSDATLSIVSEASLGYSVQDLDPELAHYNEQLLALGSNQSQNQFLADFLMPKWVLPAALKLPISTGTFNIIRTAKTLANQLGERIIREKVGKAREGEAGEDEKDVFDVLLQLGDSEKRKTTLSSEEISHQTGILLLGGQDTTSNTLAIGFLELARNPGFQEKLRAEIQASFSSLGSLKGTRAYDNMPLLNAFIKETLRMYPVGFIPERIATCDTVIPLADEIRTTKGEVITQIPVRKGQILNVGIASYQRLDSHWGEDPHEFRPSRWLDGTVAQGQAVGPYANLLTFLGGPRVCLGWRFAVLEMQVFLAELVGKFSFTFPEEGDTIRMRLTGTLSPILPSGEKGAPLCVTRV